MNDCTFIILGATGDLSKRKIIPSIYNLLKNKKIKKFSVIGVSLEPTTIKKILSESKGFIPVIDKKIWEKIEKNSWFQQMDFYDHVGYHGLRDLIKEVEKKNNLSRNRIFYLATLPNHFDVITHNLSKEKIARRGDRKKGWDRVVYEKPFGYDLKSARHINRCVSRIFDEKQVYRIDHYLGKELVSNIALVRFTNRVLEPIWNNKHIDNVQIYLSEKNDVSNRAGFYDNYGALKDVVQNHMMQLLALVAMEAPVSLGREDVRNAKAKVLKKVNPVWSVLGQYKGYRSEKGVKAGSGTETFAALELGIDNKRWRGVPFYLKTGKALDKNEVSISINFKKVNCPLTNSCSTESNILKIMVQPHEGLMLKINAKVPGQEGNVTPIKLEFCHSCTFGANTPKAYETLIQDVIAGDQSVFVRNDEIEYSWKVIEMINTMRNKIYPYKKGSPGPKRIYELSKQIGFRWLE